MLSFITYKEAPEQIEIVADDQGIEDLISYLQGVKDDKDHMHLIIGSEIHDYPIPDERKDLVFSVKSVRIEYAEAKCWRRTPKSEY